MFKKLLFIASLLSCSNLKEMHILGKYFSQGVKGPELMAAIQAGNTADVKTLLETENIHLGYKDSRQQGVLALAIEGGGSGRGINDRGEHSDVPASDVRVQIFNMVANAIEQLEDQDLKQQIVNNQNDNGNSALVVGALFGYWDQVERLLELGASPNLSNHYQGFPARFAVDMSSWKDKSEANKQKASALLVKLIPSNTSSTKGVNILDRQRQSLIFLACKNGMIDGANILLDQGADWTIPDGMKNNAMHALLSRKKITADGLKLMATMLGQAQTHDLDPTVGNQIGANALHQAIHNGHTEAVKVLLEVKEMFNRRTALNESPILIAMQGISEAQANRSRDTTVKCFEDFFGEFEYDEDIFSLVLAASPIEDLEKAASKNWQGVSPLSLASEEQQTALNNRLKELAQ